MMRFENSIADYLKVVIQVIFVYFSAILPGVIIIDISVPDVFKNWPLIFIISNAFIISTFVMVIFELLILRCKDKIIKALLIGAWIILLILLVFKYYEIISNIINNNELKLFSFIALMSLFFSLIMPLNKYPGFISLAMGDVPAFCNMAKNLYRGKRYKENYFIGDYAEGGYVYLKQCPLSVLVTAFIYNFFGVNRYSLQIYAMISGLLCVIIGAGMINHVNLLISASVISMLPYFAILILCVPTFFIYCGVGEHSLPICLSVLCSCYAFLFLPHFGIHPLLLVVLNFIYVSLYRPEGKLLVLSTIASIPVFLLYDNVYFTEIVFFIYLTFIIVIIYNIPSIISFVPKEFKDLAIFYTGYCNKSKCFKMKFNTESGLDNQNKFNVINHFKKNDIPQNIFYNASIGDEIKAHPIAYLKYVLGLFLKTLCMLLNSMTIPRGNNPVIRNKLFVFILFFSVLICVGSKLKFVPCLTIVLIYLITLQLLNSGIIVRHVLPVSMVLFILFSFQIIGFSTFIINRFNLNSIFYSNIYVLYNFEYILLIVNFIYLILTRFDRRNHTYFKILIDLKNIINKNDVIVSSYPQLFTCMFGNYSVGTGFLKEFLLYIIERHSPDIIIFDNARDDCPGSYDLNCNINGYTEITNNHIECYAIFKKNT